MKQYPLVPTVVLAALAAGSLWQSALAEEPRKAPNAPPMFIPFDVYPKHREAIGLNEDQMRELGRIAEGMGDAARHIESEMRARTEALQEALAKRPIEPEKAMERFQAVLAAENEMKALQFRSGLAAQNMLTPEQAEKMRVIAAKVLGPRDAGAGQNPAELRERLEQIRAELRKRTGGELTKDAVSALERVEQAAQQGNMEEAKKGMEGLLAKLGQGGEPRKKEGTTNPQPTAADIKEQIQKTEQDLAGADSGKRERIQQQLAKLRKMQEYLASNPDANRKEKSPGKGEPAPATFKGEGEKKPGQDKIAVKGEGEPKKFDKNAETPKRADAELRKRVEVALAEFQEAKAAGNHDAMEKITKSIESLLRESARDGSAKESSFKDGERKKESPKEGERKESAVKEGERKKEGQKDGERKEGAPKEGAVKDGAAKE